MGGVDKLSSAIGRRLAELAFELTEGKAENAIRILEAQGKQVEIAAGTVTVRSSDLTTGLVLGMGPVDQLPILMFALFGSVWPSAFAEVHTEAMKIIQQRLKVLKAEGLSAGGVS